MKGVDECLSVISGATVHVCHPGPHVSHRMNIDRPGSVAENGAVDDSDGGLYFLDSLVAERFSCKISKLSLYLNEGTDGEFLSCSQRLELLVIFFALVAYDI